jgi:NAD+ synthase
VHSAEDVRTPEMLKLDAGQEVDRICSVLRDQVFQLLRRKGIVIGLSGGVDSSVTAALAVRAIGKERVFGIMMPEVDSTDEALALGHLIANRLGIDTGVEPVAAALQAVRCYERRDAAIRTVVPEFGPAWKSKLVLANALESRVPITSIVVQSPSGEQTTARLTSAAYRQIVAATNFKQRVRKMIEYYHADRLQYAVAGTPNRLEYDQAFFVKGGDGAADVKPIAHLYKSQVYQIAEYLEVPEEIRCRPSTTDTFSLPQSQEEFYFSVPLATFDLCLYGRNHDLPAHQIAEAAGLTEAQVERLYASIDSKRRATRYLRMHPLTIEPIAEVHHAPFATEPADRG